MGQEAIYKCKKCGNQFKANEGDGFFFEEYRCLNCDTIKVIETMNRSVPVDEYKPPTKEEVGVCKKCGGELRNDIKPMCPKCKSRDVKEKKILSFYD